MSIIIQTKHCKLSPRFRHLIESYVRRAMGRELRQISSIALTIGPTTFGGESGFRCKLRLFSHFLGDIVVDDVGDRVWSTTQQVTARARHAFRRRLHKRLSKYRRIKRAELAQRLPDAVSRRLNRFDFGNDSTSRLPDKWRFVVRPTDRFNGSHDQGESH
jgi:hypothetical protein